MILLKLRFLCKGRYFYIFYTGGGGLQPFTITCPKILKIKVMSANSKLLILLYISIIHALVYQWAFIYLYAFLLFIYKKSLFYLCFYKIKAYKNNKNVTFDFFCPGRLNFSLHCVVCKAQMWN